MEILSNLGEIRADIKIIGLFKTKTLNALFDTGATWNYIKKEFSDGESVESIGISSFEGPHGVILADMTESEGTEIRFKELLIQGLCEKEPMFVMMENLSDDVIIGVTLMQKLRIAPDPITEKIKVGR